MACIHRLILKKLIDRGLVSEGNVLEQMRELMAEEQKNAAKNIAEDFAAALTPQDVMEQIERFGYDA